jgi:hypothetical protein
MGLKTNDPALNTTPLASPRIADRAWKIKRTIDPNLFHFPFEQATQ